MILIGISLMAGDVEHLLMYSLAICVISFLKKCLLIVKPITIKKNLFSRMSFYIVYMQVPFQTYDLQTFPHFMGCLFTFLLMSFEAQKFKN